MSRERAECGCMGVCANVGMCVCGCGGGVCGCVQGLKQNMREK